MGEENYKIGISLRMPLSILTAIDKEIKAKKYEDRTEAIITKIQNSYHFEELMEIAKNPELQNEMNEKIQHMISTSSIERTLETMTIKERNTLIFFATHLNEKSLMQTKLG